MPRYRPQKNTSKSISSIDNLCNALDLSSEELENAINLPEDEKYKKREVPKSNGEIRYVYNPHHAIRKVQRRINKRIFSDPGVILWPDHIFGSIPNQKESNIVSHKDYVSCAQVHCNAKSILKMDIMDFFDNISSWHVYDVFFELLDYPEHVSNALTSICTWKGNVVQGALTSSYIASLCLYDVEDNVVRRLESKGLRYTRLVDDITVSSNKHNHNFTLANSIIKEMLISKDLPVNDSKEKIQRLSTEPLAVHGLRVSFSEPRLPSKEVARIRAAVKNIERLASEPNYRTSHAYRHDYNRCMGRVNKLSRVGHKQHEALIKRLKKIRPLPSKKDKERVKKIVERLELDYPTKGDSYFYWKRHNKAHERLNIVKLKYSEFDRRMRDRLNKIKPGFK